MLGRINAVEDDRDVREELGDNIEGTLICWSIVPSKQEEWSRREFAQTYPTLCRE